MKKQTLILMALSLTLAMPTFAQKAMTKKEIAEKEKIFKALQHPWKGKRVAYFGDSITDPRMVHRDLGLRKSSHRSPKPSGYPSPSPLRDGQEHLERTHQHRHVKAQADVSQQANRADDTYPSCHLRP